MQLLHDDLNKVKGQTDPINKIVKKSSDFGMRAVALTDKANMMGCFHFYRAIKNWNY